MKILKDRNILITGCARGIGRAILAGCAKHGANIWANIRSKDDAFIEHCKTLEKLYGVKIEVLVFDITNKELLNNAIKKIRKSKLIIDGLVNNAGITYNALFQMTSQTELMNNLNVNFIGAYNLSQYVSKLMVRNKYGSIVNIASSAALDGNPGRSAYGASKGALISASLSIARELGEHNIRCNVIAPGMTKTEMLKSMSDTVIQNALKSVDLLRIGEPEEIASATVFLLSDMASYITGQVVRVDGGM